MCSFNTSLKRSAETLVLKLLPLHHISFYVFLSLALQYAETGNVQNRKQCDVLLRYWCTNSCLICVRFFSQMFWHAKGSEVAKAILNALGNGGFQQHLNQLISLRSDGPIVNKIIWNHINTYMTDEGLYGLLPFTSYTLHVSAQCISQRTLSLDMKMRNLC